ncbi:hypothetical protein MVEN_01896300 [Mycena venus]|uniref:LYR motif-containing protein Cup1-like N-terminal domain-containing protein n=1 Tax=Mycena venus TaxID=2733690 RepID=A0A8H6XEA5_9AGAR|nr:hypothetical protein MVEN_01896300 [Mycena venus]
MFAQFWTQTTFKSATEKIKRMAKDVRKLEAASKRNVQAFNHILDVAYGRKGKLKRELMEPLLTDPTAPIPPRIIPAVESSRPPVYSTELRALLTTTSSRSVGKGVSEGTLDFPPKLPARAKPNSEEARVLGPFSKRRETNTRWRYFVEQWQNARPPLQVVVENIPSDTCGAALDDIRRVGIRGLPMQGLHVFEDVETLATPRQNARRRTLEIPDHSNEPHIPRWIRRRYQQLLTRIPILTYKVPAQNKPPRYSVSLSPHRPVTRGFDADVSDVEWLAERAPPAANPSPDTGVSHMERLNVQWPNESSPPATEPAPDPQHVK